MEQTDTFTVRPEDSRPIGPAGHCTYCRERIGDPHKKECVCRRRTVVYRVTMEVVASEPAEWTPEQHAFHKNESSWCQDNFTSALREPEVGCSCGKMTFEYVRDATSNDKHTLPRMGALSESEEDEGEGDDLDL